MVNKLNNTQNTPVKEFGAKITRNEVKRNAWSDVLIEIPNGTNVPDEYQLNFSADETEEAILNTPLKYWRII